MPASSADITQLLHAAGDGDEAALKTLFPLVYEELRSRAAAQRAAAGGHATMNTTAIVHEAYLRLAGQSSPAYENRAHFFGVAAKAMRHVFLDYAKARTRKKRGGDVVHLDVGDVQVAGSPIQMGLEEAEQIVAMDEALGRLTAENPRLAQVVECRFFGGMTNEDTAAVTGTSPATVKRDWNAARAMLFADLKARGFAQ
jgi:RNA polymerase sigma factor (TIGR02999 family)